ncbi:MAG: oligosaccharyl transferase, archaeosortase A system-associated [Halobacteriales archaeon]|nr:oligosaccharyl transferase, archaeosortase A system-associated [Halobacteriales archaeon]
MSDSAETREQSVFDRLREVYHIPLLALAVLFAAWVRTRGWQQYVTDDGVLFAANDPWYHYRAVQYTVEHWPFTLGFDPWTGYPEGIAVGQFGTLFDQIIATVALVVGLGSPSEHTVQLVHLFAPVVFGALALLPIYVFTRGLSNRTGGLVAVLFSSLVSGAFLQRGLVGSSDHHIAEVFFFAVAAATVAAALRVAMAEKPVFELLIQREFDALRRPLVWGGLSGIALALYVWTWPPAVFFVGLLGIFFALAASLYQARGVSPDHVLFVGAVMGVVFAFLTLVTIDVFTIDAVKLSLLQPLLGVGLAAGCGFLAALARVWDDRDIDVRLYPLGVLGVAVVGLGAFALVLPETFDYFVGQVSRIFGYTATQESRTVQEAQPIPLGDVGSRFYRSFGFGFLVAIVGALVALYRLLTNDEPRVDLLLVLVLFVGMFLAAITQQRFGYYFAVPVAALTGYAAAFTFDLVDVRETLAEIERPTGYQVMTVLTVLLIVTAPLAVGTISQQTQAGTQRYNAVDVAQASANPGEVTRWAGTLDWMSENTPELGAYGDGTPSDLPYLGSYDRTDDYQYAEGEYGTLAWWDYGHWITVLGERIPNANPFQQNADYAANVLLAPDEQTAINLLNNGNGEETRYVMVDYQLGMPGTRKYSAPTAFSGYDVNATELQRYIYTASSIEQVIQQQDNSLARTLTLLSSQRGLRESPCPPVSGPRQPNVAGQCRRERHRLRLGAEPWYPGRLTGEPHPPVRQYERCTGVRRIRRDGPDWRRPGHADRVSPGARTVPARPREQRIVRA